MSEETPRHQEHAETAVQRRAQAARAAETRKRQQTRVRQAVDAVLKTEAGMVLWAHLFHRCGYNVSSLTSRADGEIAVLSTECKEAQRLIYIDLRKLASRELLAPAEAAAEELPIEEKQ